MKLIAQLEQRKKSFTRSSINVCSPVDFLAISETKVDSSFPTAQFNLPRFRTPYRKDVTARSAGYLHMEMGTFHKQSYKIDLSAIVLLTLKFYRLK